MRTMIRIFTVKQLFHQSGQLNRIQSCPGLNRRQTGHPDYNLLPGIGRLLSLIIEIINYFQY